MFVSKNRLLTRLLASTHTTPITCTMARVQQTPMTGPSARKFLGADRLIACFLWLPGVDERLRISFDFLKRLLLFEFYMHSLKLFLFGQFWNQSNDGERSKPLLITWIRCTRFKVHLYGYTSWYSLYGVAQPSRLFCFSMWFTHLAAFNMFQQKAFFD